MLMNTLRHYHGSPYLGAGAERTDWPADRQRFPEVVYWRRRLAALLIGMTILSLISWAFSGFLGLSGGPSGARPGRPGTSHGGAAPAASGAGGADPGGASSLNSQSPTSSPAVPGAGVRPV